MLKPAALFLSLAAVGSAQAGVLDLGINNANLFSLGSFSAQGSDVEGAVLVAGSLNASNYSINDKNKDAYGSYSLVVGGSLSYTSGSIKHGNYYVAGASAMSSVGLQSSTKSTTNPVDFNKLSSSVKNTSSSLSKVAATGSSSVQYGGMTLKGTGKSVEVFNLTGSDLSSVNNFKFSNLAKGSTLVFNVSGKNAIGFNQNGVGLDGFKDYNVVYNFYESQKLNIQNVGVYGSILAPLATVTGNGGQINGNVIVGNWLSNVQVNANHYFSAANVNGYGVMPVPEAQTYAMLLAGLGVVGFIARRRRSQQAG
ncbi:choice-of-anchor A family protein [Massilia sp. NR 4-1]|uniref:choice-of-anchor A family protein n=1 Tax=Massilia sp. NR 4-1 TaxID=1678028 RepID=UPI00067DDBE6|nr:choice-of-anchor A family protein [Massilia sp. NR 4-1]AKU22358.1 hypothetical protein ACZ75_13680 [Massilia sp. NR 4-1]